MEVSMLFVCVMGMGVTFVGLTCIIFLTMLMGKIMASLNKKQPQETAAPAVKPAVPAVPAPPVLPADGVPGEVKVAILAALAQELGFRMENVTGVDIRRA